MNNDTQPCKVCGDLTSVVFGIKFKAVPVCEDCADEIALQHIQDVIKKYPRGKEES